MDITKLDIKELKALAYDLIASRERIDRELQTVNARINQLSLEENNKKENVDSSKTKQSDS